MDDSAKVKYDMILGRYLSTELGLNLEFSEHVIKADNGPFKGSTTLIVYLGVYIFEDLNLEKITPEEWFNNSCVEEVYES